MLIMILRNLTTLLNFWHIVACRVLFDHAPHAELRRTGTNGFLHIPCPAMRRTMRVAVEEGWNNFLFEQMVERQAIRFGLDLLIMVFALFADGPAIFAIIALGPPAIKDAAIRLPVKCCFLSTGTTGFVGTDRVIEPDISAGDEIACHIDIVVF